MVHQRYGPLEPSRRRTKPLLIAGGMIVSIVLVAAGVVLINTPTASRQQARPDSGRKIGVSLSSNSAKPEGRGIRRVYAPYLANWADENLASIARASGARYLILPYLTTARPGSCALTWEGDPARVAVSSSLAAQFAQ